MKIKDLRICMLGAAAHWPHPLNPLHITGATPRFGCVLLSNLTRCGTRENSLAPHGEHVTKYPSSSSPVRSSVALLIGSWWLFVWSLLLPYHSDQPGWLLSSRGAPVGFLAKRHRPPLAWTRSNFSSPRSPETGKSLYLAPSKTGLSHN